jgi:hypothetical protein
MCTEIFIKIHKCGSSTNGGVAREFGFHRNLSGVGSQESGLTRCTKEEECRVHANHGKASLFENCRLESDASVKANKSGFTGLNAIPLATERAVRPKSLLWTVIRDPRTRAYSHYHQHHTPTIRSFHGSEGQ